MSRVFAYAATQAGIARLAQQRGQPALTIVDEGFQRRTPLRDRLNALSLEWEARRQANANAKVEIKRKAKEQAAADITKWKRKHRRTRFPVKEVRTAHGNMIAMVAVWHDVTVEDIMRKSRAHPIVAARHDAIAAVYLNCRIEGRRYLLGELGRPFGLDHTSCLYVLQKRGLR